MKAMLTAMRNALLAAAMLSLPNLPATATSLKARGRAPLRPKTVGQNSAPTQSVYPFVFHSGFWINLHHFLYEQALLRRQAAQSKQATESVPQPIDQRTPKERQLWDAAVDYYLKNMVKRDLLFDQDLVAMNDQLSESEAVRDLSKSGVNSDVAKVLESVAPVYRVHWWPQHDRANRFWIAVATPMVQQFGRTLINQLTAAYKAKWPTDPIRVDVVEYANWAGAYTTFGDGQHVHITMSTDPGNQGFAALELLFHEASHWMVGPNNGAVARAIARECKAKNKPIPRDLWHAIIFYTAGEFTRRDLSENRVTDYTPYAYRGLWARAWPNLQRPLELYWQPYLEGKVDFDKAMTNIIDAL
jgi:hypothetical protein